MENESLLRASATELAAWIRKREVRVADVVDVHIRKIEQINPSIGAVVHDRFDEARLDAERADKRLASRDPGDLPPFFGVPCTIKEAFAMRGFPQTGGVVNRRNRIATEDATAVRRLREAGAIPLGVTNVSELCMWMESNNRVYGRTKNPFDPARTAGGSSGGEGAIVGAGASPFGLGADVGGSIRMPAFFNGVFGHKPTAGLVPNTGQFPIAENDALLFLSTGPICRRAEDLFPLVQVLAGPDGHDSRTRTWTLGDPGAIRMSGLRVLDVRGNGRMPVSKDLRRAQERAKEALVDRGAVATTRKFPNLAHSLEIWSCMMSDAGGQSFKELLETSRDAPFDLLADFVALATSRSDHTLPALGLVVAERFATASKERVAKFVAMGRALRDEIEGALGDDGVMLYPSYASVAPKHGWALVPPVMWVYTAIVNVMGLPSTQVPLGLDANGVPLGVQVVGKRGDDARTIAVALELERAFGGWTPPRGFVPA
ncbi:MAG: amidase [Polyangiaceae bacterium]